MLRQADQEPRLLFAGLEGFYRQAIPASWPIVRFAVGLNLFIHGLGKIGRTAGPDSLIKRMPELGAVSYELALSLLIIELIGGACIALGLFTRFFAAAAAVEMAVITWLYLGNGYSWLTRGYEYTLMWGLVLFAVALRGGGPWSLDRAIGREL